MLRRPAFAGTFYPPYAEGLKLSIEKCFNHPLGPRKRPEIASSCGNLKGVVVPHAAYMYSGPIAAHSYLDIAQNGRPDSFILLGPNHNGIGMSESVVAKGTWETPLGKVGIDTELAEMIASNCDACTMDDYGHWGEHSIEVQLPFLQYIFGDFKFVPISMNDQTLKPSVSVGKAMAKAIKESGRNVVMVASSDFNHHEFKDVTASKDKLAIEKILKFDVGGLFSVLKERYITMCGYGGVAAVMTASKELGASTAKLLKYATSADNGGDYSATVGYGAIEFR